MKKQIPNLFTALNMFFGILALIEVFHGNISNAAFLLLFSLTFDFLDGFLARMLNARSEVGKQLDSLADLISFGLVPGAVMFALIELTKVRFDVRDVNILPYFGYLITIFTAFRLAKFNTDKRQESSFLGLPSPANAIFILSFGLMDIYFFSDSVLFSKLTTKVWFLLILTLVSCTLLVANLPLLALKFKANDAYKNRPQMAIILLSVILIIAIKITAIPFIIMVYILISQLYKEKV